MKKLITLLLAVAGMVSTASAEVVQKRIFIQNSGNWSSPTLYMYKTSDETDKPLGSWPGSTMNGYNSAYEKWYYIDVTLEKDTDYKMILNNNDGGTQSASIDYNSNDNKFFSVWGTANNQYNTNDLTYYLYNTSDGSTIEMDLSDNLVLSLTIDNTAGANNYYCIAPSFVTAWYASDSKRWSLLIRPYGDYQTLSFSNITSDQAFAKILVESNNSNAWNTNGIKAYFNLEVNLKDWTYSVSPYIERDITTANIATFSSAYAVAIPSGLTASYVTGVGENNMLATTNFVNGIPANTGALLIPNSTLDETTAYQFTPATSTDAATGNKLVASVSGGDINWTDNAESPSYYNYILTTQTVNGDAAPKFYLVNKASGNTVGAGRAYLQLSEPAPARGYFSLWDDATSINAVERAQTNSEVYDLQGRRVLNPTKGLYIVNGKKIIK